MRRLRLHHESLWFLVEGIIACQIPMRSTGMIYRGGCVNGNSRVYFLDEV